MTVHFSQLERREHYKEMVLAAEIKTEIFEIVAEIREENSYYINPDLDPNKTGLIGKHHTGITTTVGDLSSKRTSTNSQFAALTVKFFRENLGLEEGDRIAVGASGSFPALLIAVMSAGEAIGLEVVTIYSIGSSYYGANIKGFTMVEILSELNRRNCFNYEISAISLGGVDDVGRGMLADIDELKEKYEEENLIYEDDLEKNMELRKSIYHYNDSYPDVFVNIGGNVVNYDRRWESGLIKHAENDFQPQSLLGYYILNEVPVINFINIKGLAREHGLAVDPQPLPEPGEGNIYYAREYPRFISLLTLGVFFCSAFWLWRRKNKG